MMRPWGVLIGKKLHTYDGWVRAIAIENKRGCETVCYELPCES